MKAHTKPLPPLAVLLTGVMVASTSAIFIRYAQREAASIVIAAYRLVIATLILLPLAIGGHRDELQRLKRGQVGLIMLSGAFLAVHFAAWIASLRYTTVASSVVLVSTTPLWVALFSPIFLRERPTRWVVSGMVTALAGGVLVGLSEACRIDTRLICPPPAELLQGKVFLGNLLALAGALAAAAYLIIGRWLRPTLSLVGYISTVYGAAAVVLSILAVGSRQPLTGFSPAVFLAFLALAIGPQLLGHTSINYALRYLPAAFVSVALLGEPIGSTVLAFLILQETPSVLELAGGAIILVGIVLASRGSK